LSISAVQPACFFTNRFDIAYLITSLSAIDRHFGANPPDRRPHDTPINVAEAISLPVSVRSADEFATALVHDYSATVSDVVPVIYTRQFGSPRLSMGWRLFSLAIACGCLSVLIVAATLKPSPSGYGTHQEMHLEGCQFLTRTGLPCPACGMTTSFSWFVRGNLLASFYVQPMGMVLAILTTAAFWVSLYIGLTGIPALRLMSSMPVGYWLIAMFTMVILAWGWKIFIHVSGHDGWG
jgi:hypothetical protein